MCWFWGETKKKRTHTHTDSWTRFLGEYRTNVRYGARVRDWERKVKYRWDVFDANENNNECSNIKWTKRATHTYLPFALIQLSFQALFSYGCWLFLLPTSVLAMLIPYILRTCVHILFNSMLVCVHVCESKVCLPLHGDGIQHMR